MNTPPRELIERIIILAGLAQMVGGLIWSIWIIRAFRRDLKRSREGLCMSCGFDLRHSKSRCPECGEPILKSR